MDKKQREISLWIMALILTAGASFYAGTVFEKKSIPAIQSVNFRNGAGNFSRQNDYPQNRIQGTKGAVNRDAGRMGQGGMDFVVGEITAKDDKSITIKTQDGSSKVVYFSSSTPIGKSEQGSLDDLSVGKQVSVNGKSDDSGIFSANNIQIRP